MAALIANKRVTYAGRVFRPGVVFSASLAHARVLVAAGVAGFASETAGAPGIDPLDELRAAYTAKTGESPDKRWGVKRLTKEIAAP